MIGGVKVDPFGRTTLRGLWAAGEVAWRAELHGANRLAEQSFVGRACLRGHLRRFG
jgi:L-aspartate oxidase